MAALTSSIPTVKAQLVSLIAAALATSGPSSTQVEVTYSYSGKPPDRETVYLGLTRGAVVVPNIKAGRKQRQESYTVEIIVHVTNPSFNQSEAEARAFVLGAAVENALANDPTLGLQATLPTFWATLGNVEVNTGIADEGAEAVIRYEVAAECRLT